MKKLVAALLIGVMATEISLVAVDGKKASYFGGTAAEFSGAKEPIEGVLDTSNPEALLFAAEKKPFKGVTLSIPYSQVLDLEYGQKAGRRVGAAIGTTILLGPLGLLTLFSKKRKHYLTVGFKDQGGTDQVAVIELGKDIVRTTLPIVETRSGKSIEYQDDEARKSAGR